MPIFQIERNFTMKKNTDHTYTATKEIQGTTYRAQFNGVREYVRATEMCKGDELKMDEYLLSNVIVEPPGMKLDDFENVDEYRAVIRFAVSVMLGRFRNESEPVGDSGSGTAELDAVASDSQ